MGGYSGLSKEVAAEYKGPLRQVALYCETRAVRGPFMENGESARRHARFALEFNCELEREASEAE